MKKLRDRNNLASKKENQMHRQRLSHPSFYAARIKGVPCACQEELETVQLDGVLGDAQFGQEVGNLDPLVTLELDDLAGLLIFDEGTVASEFLSDRTKSVSGQT